MIGQPHPACSSVASWTFVALLLCGLHACSRSDKSLAPRAASSQAPLREVSAPSPARATAAFKRHPGGTRVVAIGDVHGDLSATRAALRLAGAIDPSDRWIGGPLVLVQTGDQLDRGDEERAIVDLFDRLVDEARAAGGAVIPLNGNHETMNVQGDLRYVTPKGFTTFDGVTPRSPFAERFPEPQRSRAAAFLPGGAYALKLAKRDVIAVVGDSVFAHGGVLTAHVEYGIERINQEVRRWMSGQSREIPAAVVGDDTPVWTRFYGGPEAGSAVCAELDRVLAALEGKRLVVGHTIQRGGISSACDERLFRIDVGMSSYYGKAPIQVLEIVDGKARTLSADREALLGQTPAPALSR